MKIWGMWLMPGGEDLTDEAIRQDCIPIGWGTPKYEERNDEELKRSLKHHYGKEAKPGYVAEQMFTFLREMKPGHIILLPRHSHAVPSQERDQCYLARVRRGSRGKEIERRRFGHVGELYCRPVEFLNLDLPWRKSRLPPTLRKALRSRNTVWPLTHLCRTIDPRVAKLANENPSGDADRAPSRSRKASDRFNHLNRALHYILEGGRRWRIPRHQNYQVRLKRHLDRNRVTTRVLEEEFVDVKFKWNGHTFIGEIKVTAEHISPKAAFRAALGQILEYKHIKTVGRSAQMIIFLDKQVGDERVELASKLGIALVVEGARGKYHLLGGPSKATSRLRSLFPEKSGDL